MILSRRSFLKVAGLSAVAVAGASMFTGCSVNNLISTGVVYSAQDGSGITEDVIKKLNENKTANAILGHSDLHHDATERANKINAQLITAAKFGLKEAEGLEVASSDIVKKTDKDGKDVIENGKQVYIIKAVLKKTEKK